MTNHLRDLYHIDSAIPKQATTINLYSRNILVVTVPDEVTIQNDPAPRANFTITAVGPGETEIIMNTTSQEISNISHNYIKVEVIRSQTLLVINAIIGWLYFLAWTISFYPQVLENWQRKSVIGLNFDLVALNLIGFSAYAAFNINLFWVDEIKKEYKALHPYEIIPVKGNDVFFGIHSVILTIFLILQCIRYERGNQKVSRTGTILVSGSTIFIFVSLILAIVGKISWLNFFYYLSYVKLGVNVVKNVPQVYLNYKRQSTEGWSITGVLLDVVGGVFSVLQMILIAYNHDDWGSMLGNPTKFGLGVLSIAFDVIFIIQHYILYKRDKTYVTLINS
ncbi:uncharacterized protein TRIADDRAFT_54169 [Trichoplax adhaerens]|uniref:Cystinosin n=1 Tax=Trichoplax adhaerens TaxID=10228 RepID=B3RRA9_TRIAD|nr:hypothetical protein TRIADDRAFT_54169 [Trichoplax adhaerens]EDV26846.1 hypothetical protein TRIADDRAFT_54169 [Trichoplax adhaerens]|eukprot:XP_002110842.1 hypothetical protein TRIADDRAFT_54169 [Trichoplax adhaerens]